MKSLPMLRASLFRDRPRRESFEVRALRRLSLVRRYVQWGQLAFSGMAAAPRSAVTKFARRAKPFDQAQDFTCVPAYYQPMIESLELPDRPPLTPFERALPGEASAIRRVAQIAASAVVRGYCDVKKADPSAKAMRDQHAKHHACLQAHLVVRDDLPPEFEIGVFRRGSRYDAVVRFSNAMGRCQSDRKWDGRGMAVKLFNADPATKLAPGFPSGEQDFLMTNHPVFFCKDVADYAEFMIITSLPGDTFGARVRAMAKFVLFFVPWRLPQLWIFLVHIMKQIKSPLRVAYHSMTPYLLGDDKVVRYIATPLQTPRGSSSRRTWGKPNDNFLRDALTAELDPEHHNAEEKAVFDFSLRVRHAPTQHDVEDASRVWEEAEDRTISLGRIEIPLQSFNRSDKICACENWSFNPWNSLPQHRPVGGLNRMRLAVYLASVQVRHCLNMTRLQQGGSPLQDGSTTAKVRG
jgi:Catalase